MAPPEHGLEDVGCAYPQPQVGEPVAQQAADDHVGFRAGPALGHVEGVGKDGGNHESGDEAHGDQRIGVTGQVEAEPVGLDRPPPDQRPGQHNQQDHRQDVQIGGINPDAGLGEQFLRKMPPGRGGEYEYTIAEQEGEKAPKDGGVADAGPVPCRDPLEDFALSEDDDKRAHKPLDRVVEASLGFALADEAYHPIVEGVAGNRHGHGQRQVDSYPDGQRTDISGRHHILRTLHDERFGRAGSQPLPDRNGSPGKWSDNERHVNGSR